MGSLTRTVTAALSPVTHRNTHHEEYSCFKYICMKLLRVRNLKKSKFFLLKIAGVQSIITFRRLHVFVYSMLTSSKCSSE
jgi:hypothetical protein